MKYINRNRDGYTLVELLLTLALIGIVMVPISSFLISNIKSFNRADDQIELQYQAQMAMNTITKDIIDAKQIAVNPTIATITVDGEHIEIIKKISFKRVNEAGQIKYSIYEHKIGENNILKLFNTFSTNPNASATTEFADYIEYLKIEPINGDYIDCDGIRIIINLKKKDTSLMVKNEIYFRN